MSSNIVEPISVHARCFYAALLFDECIALDEGDKGHEFPHDGVLPSWG